MALFPQECRFESGLHQCLLSLLLLLLVVGGGDDGERASVTSQSWFLFTTALDFSLLTSIDLAGTDTARRGLALNKKLKCRHFLCTVMAHPAV